MLQESAHLRKTKFRHWVEFSFSFKGNAERKITFFTNEEESDILYHDRYTTTGVATTNNATTGNTTTDIYLWRIGRQCGSKPCGGRYGGRQCGELSGGRQCSNRCTGKEGR